MKRNVSDIVKKPVVSEKATELQKLGKYVFIVSPRATKPEVKKAIRELYNVRVRNVEVMNRHPKGKRFRGVQGKQAGYRKAIVTLESGEKIDLQ